MKLFQRIALAVGTATLGVLLWRMDAAEIGRLVAHVGWGMALILGQEIVAHLFNAVAWRFAFAPEEVSSFPFPELLRLRIIGDSFNYLTPGGTIPGEIMRATLLNRSRGRRARATSVLVAKCTQSAGHCLFMICGLTVIARRSPAAQPYVPWITLAAAGVAATLIAGVAYTARAKVPRQLPQEDEPVSLRAMAGWVKGYFSAHPGRVFASLFFFMLGFSWGAFEAYWICRFLGIPVSAATALTIEMLSMAIDGFFFLVPAKMGTQEGGKTAIFALLGLPLREGFAFGVVRHIRELAWAGLGLALYSTAR